jgi:hypothetical protein
VRQTPQGKGRIAILRKVSNPEPFSTLLIAGAVGISAMAIARVGFIRYNKKKSLEKGKSI